jgi:hypothetical protein
MVDRKILTGTAILTLVIITFENILPGKINALVRGVNISIQANYRRHRIALGDRVEFVPVGRPDHFTLVQKHQDKGAFNRTDHEGTVILIEH